jgi:hypothetical protein
MNSVDRTVGPPFLFPSSQWMIRLLVVLMQDPSFAVDRFKVPPSSVVVAWLHLRRSPRSRRAARRQCAGWTSILGVTGMILYGLRYIPLRANLRRNALPILLAVGSHPASYVSLSLSPSRPLLPTI